MKTLHYSIIILLTVGLLAFATNSVYAPCLVGVIDCGPPPGVTVSASTDSQFYEKNDTIHILGQVYVQNYSKPIRIQVINPDNVIIQNIDTPVTNGKYGLKIRANFDTTGVYQIVTCVQSWCDRSYFKFIAEPYKISVNGQDFFIQYKSFADLVGMEADINNNSLRIHATNATSQGLQFVIELPRALIDSTQYDKDASFTVLYGEQQPDKYMQPASFTEIANNNLSRTLAIDIPYEPVPNASGTWDFKISSVETTPRPSVFVESPLKQFKSGIKISNIQCSHDLHLVIKAEDKTPACIKQDSISKLILRSWINEIPSLRQNNEIFGDFYQGIENNSGIVSIKNQTFYTMTAANTTYPITSGMTVKFHQVIFSFPYGPQDTPGGVIIPFDMTFPDGTTEVYGKIVKNQDGSDSLSGIGLGPGPLSNRTDTVQSDHMHPQAGVTMTEDQIKLLVSTDNQTVNPLGIVALVKYAPINMDLASGPNYHFYLKINSNSTAYLLGYDICGNDLCVKNNTLSILLPVNNIQIPNYTAIGLSENKKWNYGDMVNIRLEVSPSQDNKTAYFLDIKNSTIVP